MTQPLPVAFHDLPPSAFPMTVELVDRLSGDVVWSVQVDGPGAVKVPGRDERPGGDVIARVTFADGHAAQSDPPQET